MRTIWEQFLTEHGDLPSSSSNEEPRRTKKITYLDYLDTVEVIGSIPVIESYVVMLPAGST